MKILYVEDDPHHADLTVRSLQKAAPQARLETASTLREAYARLARLASDPLDLVLTDMHLRDGDGLSLLQHIRESSLPVAVVLITGMGDEETAVAALKARADDYVIKHKDYLQRLPVILESALNHYRADAARRAYPLSILYADDEFGDVENARRHFAVHADHLHLDAVFTGPEVLSALQRQDGAPHYDVLLMNFDLHGLKALEVLREVRLTHRQDVPVVLLCRAGDEELARQGLTLGASSYLVKSPGYLYQLPWELEEAHSRAELLRREAALQASEEKYRTLFDSIDEGFCVFEVICDGEGRPVDLLFSVTNPAFGRQTGWGDVVGQRVRELLPDLEDAWLEKYGQVAATGEPQRFTERAAGLNRWYEVYAFRVGEAESRTVAVIFSDVSERIRAEEAIRRSEAVLAQAGRMANLGAWEVDLSHSDDLIECPVVWSEQVYRIFGYEPGSVEVTAEVFFRHVHSADRRRLEEAIRTAIEKREPYGTEYRIKRADGVERVVHGNAVVEVDGAGRPRRIIGAMQDVTERKRAEESLRTSEEFNRRIVESSSDCIKILDLEGRLLYISPRGQVLLGIEDPAAHINGSWIELWPGEGRLAALETLAQSRAGGVGSFQAFGPTPQGQPKWWDTVITPMTDARGQVVRLLAVSRDITESKQSEESLKTALAEVRQLKDRLQEENIYLQEEVQGANNFGEIIGRSEMLRRVLSQVEKVGPTGTTCLILGETGTGKELLARAIHDLSPQRRHAMVKVNCAALPAPLIESELFGHEKGAFTGATAQRRGRFELADGGTILLDEVGELPLDLQAKLLRVLEEGEFERVGGSRTVRVDVRVIAATNRRLEEAVQEGTFRSDLYYRLSVYPITLPPLRKRREDIPILVRHFVKELSVKMGKKIETIPHHAMNALQNYSWPGNIRELRNVIERAVIITRGTTLRLTDDLGSQSLEEGSHLTERPEPLQGDYGATETLAQSEYNQILRTLRRVNWKVEGPGGAAALLDIHPSTLRTRMRKLGINRSQVHAP